MTYTTPDGRRFVLVHHSPNAWADRLEAALVDLGCSTLYAAAAVAPIRGAVRP